MDDKVKNKKILLYLDDFINYKDLSNEELGELFRCVLDYYITKQFKTDNRIIKIIFERIKNNLDTLEKEYKKISEKRKLAGAIGGKQKIANSSKCYQNVANSSNNNNNNIKEEYKEEYKEKELKEKNNTSIIKKENDFEIETIEKKDTNNFFIYYKNFSKLKQYDEFVYIKESEYNKLILFYPQKIINEAIKKLNDWKLEKYDKKKYNECKGDDYRKLTNWVINSVLENLKKLDYDEFQKIYSNIKKAQNPEIIKKCEEMVVAEYMNWEQAKRFTEHQINDCYLDFKNRQNKLEAKYEPYGINGTRKQIE